MSWKITPKGAVQKNGVHFYPLILIRFLGHQGVMVEAVQLNEPGAVKGIYIKKFYEFYFSKLKFPASS